MLEMLINPKKAERNSWELFFVGLFYASLSFIIVNWIFKTDVVNVKYSGWILVAFTVMFSMPFIYYIIKLEEQKDIQMEGYLKLLKEHSKALFAFLWLFLGFVVALSFLYIMFGSTTHSFTAQIETYCSINKPGNIDDCVEQYGIKGNIDDCVEQYGIKGNTKTTAFLTAKERLVAIFVNNIYVLMFTIFFSLVFGAGVIFVLAWNASVIAAAIGIFAKSSYSSLPLGIARYMIHGLPEIAAYFIAALAGGIVSIAVIRHDTKSEKFWNILQDSLNLVIVAVVVLFISALIEVFITPFLF